MLLAIRPLAVAALAIAGVAVAASSTHAQSAILDGKKIFLDQKCNTCHAVSSAEIAPTSKIKAPDLAGLAAKEDATFLGKYLRRQADKNGKKHLKPFTGSDEEMGALISWLQKQTAPAKK